MAVEGPEGVRRSRQARAGGARATRISHTETAVPESGCLVAARGAERGRGVQRGACREPLRVRSSRACRRGSVIASDRRNCRWDDLTTEGRTGLPILGFRPPTRPSTAGRSLGSRCRTDATNTCQNFQRRQEWFCSTSVPSTGVTKPHRVNAHQRGLRDSGLRTGRDGPES